MADLSDNYFATDHRKQTIQRKVFDLLLKRSLFLTADSLAVLDKEGVHLCKNSILLFLVSAVGMLFHFDSELFDLQ